MECLDSLVIGEAEGVEETTGGAGGVLGAVAGLAGVAAEERGLMLPPFMLENTCGSR